MFENLVASYEDPHEGLKRFTQAYLACVTADDTGLLTGLGKTVQAPLIPGCGS